MNSVIKRFYENNEIVEKLAIKVLSYLFLGRYKKEKKKYADENSRIDMLIAAT